MSERGKRPNYSADSPYGRSLRELNLRKRDVIVFSQMYKKSDSEAAEVLISERFDGREITQRRGIGWYDKPRIPRSEAARDVFIQYYGEPVPQGKKKTPTRKQWIKENVQKFSRKKSKKGSHQIP